MLEQLSVKLFDRDTFIHGKLLRMIKNLNLNMIKIHFYNQKTMFYQ